MDNPAAWNMSIAKNSITAGMFLCITPDASYHISPMETLPISVIHNFNLSKMNGF